jgi:hypothetical protein
MPPASQGVEQRSERPAGRTGRRWGLRAVVVGGLAGAAWMLSGAAAHAAENTSAEQATGLAVLSPARTVEPLVPDLGDEAAERIVRPVVKHVDRPPAAPVRDLLTAHRPSQQERPRSGEANDVTLPGSLTDQLTPVVVKPARVLATTVGDAVSSTDGSGVPDAVRELTAPLRLTGGPVGTTVITPVTRTVRVAPPARALRPGTALLHHEAVPVAAHEPATAAPTRTVAVAGPARIPGAPSVVRLPAVDPAGRPATGGHPPDQGGNGTDVARRSADVDRHPAATTAAPVSVRPGPRSPEPAPLRVHLGDVSIPAPGPGAPSEGGCPATVPAAVAASRMACHRLAIATDVEVRRYDAGSPTVSPD